MQLHCPYVTIFHDVSESFGPLLQLAMDDKESFIGVGLGPIYQKDPAEELLFPYVRADVESGWSSKPKFPNGVPEHISVRARELRQLCVDNYFHSSSWLDASNDDERMIDDWTRAGLVLEVCSRRGVNIRGFGKAHVKWRLNGTETGRFGASYTWNKSSAFPNGFNPLTIPKAERNLVVPSAGGRLVAVIDFKAMDVSSMLKLAPGLDRRYGDHWDLHLRTSELIGCTRDEAKEQIFVHAYGGYSPMKAKFEQLIPELNDARKMPHGDFPRSVQSLSAKAFRAGLARALPLLLSDDIVPMFTVHDELVLDVSETCIDRVIDVANAMQEGATDRIGVRYTTSLEWGLSYGEAKKTI